MIDGPFRRYLETVTPPLIRGYALLGITPNFLSVASMVIAVGAAWLCARDHLLAAAAVWWVSRLLDGTDGILARSSGQATAFGAYLDILCDMVSYSIMVVAFAHRFPELTLIWLLTLFMYVLCIASALALGALEQGRTLPVRDNRGLRLGAGLAEAGETGIAYTCFLIFPQWLEILSVAWLVILVVTVAARSGLAYRVLREPAATAAGAVSREGSV